MPGPHKGYTTPHRCSTVNNPKRNKPSDRDCQTKCRLQEKASNSHVQFHGPVYLSIGLDAKDTYIKLLIQTDLYPYI